MRYKIFVEKINSLLNNKEDLYNLGYSREFVEMIYSRFKIGFKKVNFSYNNELLSLINNCDLSSFNIRELVFFDNTFTTQDAIFFGKYDDYPLGISRLSKEIIMFNQNNESIIMKVSTNASAFLDALFVIAKYTSDGILKKEKPQISMIIEEATTLLGGYEYNSFCRLIFGV